MASLISHLSETEKQQLFDDLNYLNLAEIRTYCREQRIPTHIYVEYATGQRKKTKETDRKSIILARIRHFLTTGKIAPPTCFPASVVKDDEPPKKLQPEHRLYYGWYDKHNPAMIALLQDLTNGTFRDGAIARILVRQFWTSGEAPTFTEFANAWIKANKAGLGIESGRHPEAAWLTDRAKGLAGKDWKSKRQQRAERVLALLNGLESG